MLQSLGYSENDWPGVHAVHAQSQGITKEPASQWEEEDGLCDFIVTKGGGEHAARTVGANMLSSGLYNIQSVYVWDNLWSQIKSVARREEHRAGLRSSPQQDQHSPYTVQTSS